MGDAGDSSESTDGLLGGASNVVVKVGNVASADGGDESQNNGSLGKFLKIIKKIAPKPPVFFASHDSLVFVLHLEMVATENIPCTFWLEFLEMYPKKMISGNLSTSAEGTL